MASNRIGKETIQTEHGKSEITFYGNSFITGISNVDFLFTWHNKNIVRYVTETWVQVSDTGADPRVKFIVLEYLGFLDMNP